MGKAVFLGEVRTSPVGKKVYQNAVYGFSFEYPEDFRITEIPEDLGTTILVEKPGTRESFQIFISEFDEPGPITAERVRQDLPDLPMENPQQVILGSRTSDGSPTSGGITALIFFGEDAALGKTREVWFIWPDDPRVAGNYLYQVTTYPDLDGLVGPVMDSLTFK